MFVQRLILSQLLLLGLLNVALAYPAPDASVPGSELETRDPIGVSPVISLEALCDKNCVATRNKCAANGGAVDICETNSNICIKQCALQYGTDNKMRDLSSELETRDSDSSLSVRSPTLLGGNPTISLEALCDKNCVAKKNNCAVNDGGLLACEANARVCIQRCASILPPKPKEKRDLSLETRDAGLSARAPLGGTPLISLEALCDKNCIATRNNCAANKVSPVDICEQNSDICQKRCNIIYGQSLINKRDPVIPPTEPNLNLEAICDKNCTAKRNNCVATGGLVDACERNHNVCLNQCQFAYGN